MKPEARASSERVLARWTHRCTVKQRFAYNEFTYDPVELRPSRPQT